MFNKINMYFNNEKELFIEDKKKYILLRIIYFSILLFMFMLPSFSYTSLHNVPLLFAAALCVLLFIYVLNYGDFFIDKKIIFTIFFCIFCLFSSIINDINRLEKTPFLLSIIFIMFYEFLLQDNQRFISIKLMFYGLLFFSIYYFILYFNEIITLNFTRLGNIFGNENAMSQYFHLGVILGVYIFYKNRNFLYLIVSLIMLILGLTSGSKTYIFGLLLALLIFVIFVFGKKKWYISCVLVLCGIAVLIIIINLPGFETLKIRINEFLGFLGIRNNGTRDYSSAIRADMFISGLNYFSKKPIFGYGYEGFAFNNVYLTYSHNTISELLCNFGLCGFVCFEYPLFNLLSNKRNITKEENVAKYMILVSNLFFHFTSVLFGSKIFYISLAIMCSLDKEEISFENNEKLFYLR